MTWRHSGDRLSGFVIKKYRRRNSGEWTEAEEEIETERTARRRGIPQGAIGNISSAYAQPDQWETPVLYVSELT